MLNKKIALLGAAAIAMVSTGANAATESADARVQIIAAVTLTETASLDFGIVASAAAGGTITVDALSGARSCGLLICVGTPIRGTFNVVGAAGQTVVIGVDPTTTLSNGAVTMPVSLVPSTTTIAANGGDQTFYVGGSLTVGASQAAGTYNGTYNVTAEYQ